MKATLIEKLIVQVVGFVQGVILARMLCPEDFGLAAMLGIFISVGTMFAEGGLGTALVVKGAGGREWGVVRKVLVWNVGMAIIVYAVLAIAAPFIAAFYNAEILMPLTWVMGANIVFGAVCVSRVAVMQRNQKFGKLAIANILTTIIGFILAILLAINDFGVWTIAWTAVGASVVKLIAVFALGRNESEYSEDKVEFKDLLNYGIKQTASGLIHVVYSNLYNIIIGKMVNPAAVGLFVRGQRWAMLPGEVVNESVGRVALPSLAKGETSLGFRVGSLGLRVGWTWVNAALLWPGLAVLWIWAEEIVRFVLGAQWLECVPYLRIIIIGQLFTPISVIAIKRIQASGKMNLLLLTDAIKKPLQIGSLVVGAFYGVAGLCWAVVASEAIEAVVDSMVVWKNDGR